jgi:hypothetical protein
VTGISRPAALGKPVGRGVTTTGPDALETKTVEAEQL